MSQLLERLKKALAPRYEVIRELARGAMGIVFLAEDTVLECQVAVKVLDPRRATDWAAGRFIREARLLAGLSHSHIVSVHNAGEADGLSYYVMDYIAEETLEQRLARGTLTPAEAVKLGRDLLDALDSVHGRGIIHRDIKPANIFMLERRALLADFGIAKPSPDSDDTQTTPGAAVGTPRYMPPEQLAGLAVTPRADLYAVGMVLYEGLTGRDWKTGSDPSEGNWHGVPFRIARVLKRALQYDPAERWPDAHAFRRALWSTRTARYRMRTAAGVVGSIIGTALLVMVAPRSCSGPDLGRVPPGMWPANREARRALVQAELLFAGANWASAGTAYRRAYEADSTCVWCLWMLTEIGRWYMEPPSSIHVAAIDANLDRFPDDYRVLIESRRLPLAQRLDTLGWAEQQWPRNALVAFRSGSELFHRGPLVNRQRQESRERFRTVVRLDTDFAPAWEFLAWLETAEGSQDAAREALAHIPLDGETDPIALPLRILLNLGYGYRFGDQQRIATTLALLSGGGGEDILADVFAPAGPRMLPAFGTPEGAIDLGGRWTRAGVANLAISGLAAQVFGLFARGQLDSARTRIDSIDRTFGDALGFGLFWSKMMAVLAIFDPPAVPDPQLVWRELSRYQRSVSITESERHGVNWIFALREGRLSPEPSRTGDADRLHLVIEAMMAADAGDPERAIWLTDQLGDFEAATALGDEGEEVRKLDEFFRTVLHLLRSRWYLASGDSVPAAEVLRWHQHSDQATLPTAEPQPQEVDWAFGPLASWQKANILAGLGIRRPEMCDAYRYVARAWRDGNEPYGFRADTAATKLQEFQCPN